jgi:hypothetical protein
MSVVVVLLLIAIGGGVGGAGFGLLTYGGIIMPKTITHDITVGSEGATQKVPFKMFVPGVIGHVVIGALSAVIIYCVYAGSSIVLSWKTVTALTLYQFGIALLTGLSGSKAINDLIEKQQWAQLAPVLKQSDPSANPLPMQGSALRPFQAMQLM